MNETTRAALFNYTPHAITLQGPDGVRVTYPSSGVARVLNDAVAILVGDVGGIPIYQAPSGAGAVVVGLPDPVPGVTYVVSGLCAGFVKGRTDVVSPGTGPADGAIREAGQIVAVTRLIRAC